MGPRGSGPSRPHGAAILRAVPGIDTNRGAKRAREARRRWDLGDRAPLPCVLTVAEHHGGVPVIVAALPRACAGACAPAGPGGGRVVWVNGAQAVVRQRFTVAHELGHVVCGHGGDRALVDTPATLADEHDPCEVQANAFAAELLAPREGVRALVTAPRPSLEDVVRVALTFGVSTAVALFRLRTLGLASAPHADVLRGELAEGLDAHVRPAVAAEVAPVDDVLACHHRAAAAAAVAAGLRAGGGPARRGQRRRRRAGGRRPRRRVRGGRGAPGRPALGRHGLRDRAAAGVPADVAVAEAADPARARAVGRLPAQQALEQLRQASAGRPPRARRARRR